jgi:hypothetical protein
MAQLKKVIAAADTAAKASRTEQVEALKKLDTQHNPVNQITAAIDALLARFGPE